MTETLKNALTEHADAISFAPVDLRSIHRDGDRSVRRRRVGLTVSGLVAASTVAVATALAVLPGADDSSGRSPIATDPGALGTIEVTWVEGSTLHRAGSVDLDLGRPAMAFVRTSVGYVFADASGAVFSVVGADVERVGSTDPDAIRLLSDPAGPRAVWVDVDGSGIVTYDQASGADLTLKERFTDAVPVLTAMDGDTAYADVGRQARSVDLVTGETAVVARDGSSVLDASAGNLALGDDSGIRLSTQGRVSQDTVLRDSYGDVGTFSPDGAWFSSDADQPQVVNTSSGERVTLDTPDFFATGYEFLDATTLVVISQASEEAPMTLLTCQVPEGTCTQVADLGSAAQLELTGFELPVGIPMG